jgi:hypothetical protein
MSQNRKWLIKGFLALAIIVTMALIVTMLVGANDGALTLQMGDADYSDSPLAWVIVIPILIVVCVIAAVITVFAVGASLVLTLLALAMAVFLGVFALLLGLSPLLVLLAIPALAIYGFVKLVQPKSSAVPRLTNTVSG